MNLKQAASQLGVHYQTAYRWVRSGDLAAVRVGARYEVSDAAIHQFIATRQSVLRQAIPSNTPAPPTTGEPEEFLLDLEAMAGDPLLSVPAVTNYAARRGSEVLGDLCVVVVLAPDGTVERASVDHPRPDRAAFIASALSVPGAAPPRPAGLLASVFDDGRALRIPHIPQDRLRAGIRPELRQYLGDHPLHSLLAASFTEDGRPRGVVIFARDRPAHPYTEIDEEFAVRCAARIGTLVTAAREIADAWRAREKLAARFHEWLANQPQGQPLDPESVRQILDQDDGPTILAVVYDPDGRVIGATKTTEDSTGYADGSLVGRSYADLIDDDDLTTERANFTRLANGEVDYLDFHANRRRADGEMVEIAMHRVAVRRLDSTLACVVSVGRFVRVSTRVRDLLGDRTPTEGADGIAG